MCIHKPQINSKRPNYDNRDNGQGQTQFTILKHNEIYKEQHYTLPISSGECRCSTRVSSFCSTSYI